jgi:hypothetical protein
MKAIFEILIPVLIQIESGGDVNAIGDGGKAVGCLQIHEIMVDDVNRIKDKVVYTKYKFKYSCRNEEWTSVMMCEIYLEYYYRKYVNWWNEQCSKPLYHPMPFDVCEILARLWNGGYEGLKRNPRATDDYWSKVKKELVQ